jgi:hypothetical protein
MNGLLIHCHIAHKQKVSIHKVLYKVILYVVKEQENINKHLLLVINSRKLNYLVIQVNRTKYIINMLGTRIK